MEDRTQDLEGLENVEQIADRREVVQVLSVRHAQLRVVANQPCSWMLRTADMVRLASPE